MYVSTRWKPAPLPEPRPIEADAVLTLLHEKYPQPHPDSRLTPEHPDAQIIDGVLPAYDVPESTLSDYLRPDWSDACINVRTEENFEKIL